MIVAPNSPSPRASASADAAPRPPAASGSAIRAKTRAGPAPSVRAASMRAPSTASKAPARNDVGGRSADQEDSAVGDRARLDADEQGITCDVVAECTDQLCGRG